MKKKTCSNCGAPITTEICPYCNAMTGIDTKNANMEYPVIECKEANIGFWSVVFPMIFAVSFGFAGLVMPFIFMTADTDGVFPSHMLLFFLPFALVGIVAFVIAARSILKYMAVKTKGQDIDATVYGYMDDNVLINGHHAQIVKLLVQTNDGPKFILYQLGDIKKPYKVNGTIKLKVYKDIFLIENKKQYYFE